MPVRALCVGSVSLLVDALLVVLQLFREWVKVRWFLSEQHPSTPDRPVKD